MKWLVRVAACVVLIGTGFILASCGPKSPAEQLALGTRLTAKEAWSYIEPEAQAWKKGSLIISARPPSRPGKEDLDTDGRSSAWRFIVGPEGDPLPGIYTLDTTAKPIKPHRTEQRRPLPPAYVDPAQWNVDSPEAIQIALENGLQEWMAAHEMFAIKRLGIELGATAEQGPVWTITAKDGADVFSIVISAVDGTVLESSS